MAETFFGGLIVKLADFGFLDYLLPFMLTFAISFALLRKSKILSENLATNGLVAFSIGMLIMAFPAFTNLSFTEQFSTFFVQITMLILVLVVIAIIGSMFFPDLGKMVGNFGKNPLILVGIFIITALIFVSSGLFGIFSDPLDPEKTGIEPDVPGPDSDVILLIGAAIFIAVLILIFTLAAAIKSNAGN